MIENKILESRLILKESSFVGSSVSKCANRLMVFSMSYKSETAKEDSNAYLREITGYKLDMLKARNMTGAYRKELHAYEETSEKIVAEIRLAEAHIQGNFLNSRATFYLFAQPWNKTSCTKSKSALTEKSWRLQVKVLMLVRPGRSSSASSKQWRKQCR
jgi:hypothetical protein